MRAETVLAAVKSRETGMGLEDEIGLAGEPEARVMEVRKHGLGSCVGRGICGAEELSWADGTSGICASAGPDAAITAEAHNTNLNQRLAGPANWISILINLNLSRAVNYD